MQTSLPSTSQPATILIVDDTPANLGVMVNQLEGYGFRVLVAQDGEEGIQRAELTHPDLILLDVIMPTIDGFETCRRLKAHTKTQDIPVIFTTVLTETTDKVTGFAVGGVDYVTKPFQIEEVLARVRTHIALHTLQKQLIEQNVQLQKAETALQQANVELVEANERLKELDQLKDEFVANITHDLRTPLTSINLYLNLLQKRGAAQLDRYLSILLRETQRLTCLIEDLLTLSRLDRGIVFVPEPQVLDSLLAEVLQVHALRAAGKGLQLIHDPNPDVPAVPVDYAQMMQVFTNLIGNAIAYTPPNGRITCWVTLATPTQVAIMVSNTGTVISPEDLPHLFERFYQGQTGRQSGETGTGLGLAICKKIVERHGGHIEVESDAGRETTFRVRLPL